MVSAQSTSQAGTQRAAHSEAHNSCSCRGDEGLGQFEDLAASAAQLFPLVPAIETVHALCNVAGNFEVLHLQQQVQGSAVQPSQCCRGRRQIQLHSQRTQNKGLSPRTGVHRVGARAGTVLTASAEAVRAGGASHSMAVYSTCLIVANRHHICLQRSRHLVQRPHTRCRAAQTDQAGALHAACLLCRERAASQHSDSWAIAAGQRGPSAVA